MEHSFNVEIAKEYGIVEAILLKHIYYWILKNKANNKYFYDDNYWTYNSTKAFAELFPYLSKRQIEYSLKKLIDKGLIVKGNYNKVTYDRTSWYAITKLGYSILQNCEIEMTNLLNRNDENVKPIPDINTNINTGSKIIFKIAPAIIEVIANLGFPSALIIEFNVVPIIIKGSPNAI